jgi:hypothetical protein
MPLVASGSAAVYICHDSFYPLIVVAGKSLMSGD